MARRNRVAPFVHAIKKNRDGSITRKVFGGTSWRNLASITIVDQFGETHTIPKQGWEEVPEDYGQTAPAPLKDLNKPEVEEVVVVRKPRKTRVKK